VTEIRRQERDEEILQAYAESFARRLRQGEKPSIEEYEARHPELASRIQEILSAVDRLEKLRVGESDRFLPTAAGRMDPGSGSGDVTTRAGTYSVLGAIQDILGEAPDVKLRTQLGEESAPPRGVAAAAEGIGKYHLSGTIGSGGMGTVLKAFDSDLRRWVAMKVVRQDVGKSKEHLSRFIEEAQVCGQLEHPNIPPVHEMGVESSGGIYFTMKLVKGRTLHQIARDLSLGRPEVRREFTPIRIAQVLQQAAMGVHYANVRGVVHRDLKPDNIMVGDYGEVLVMDWGLAKVIGDESAVDTFGEDPVTTARTESGMHTLAGIVQGTPSYMCPEQAWGGKDGLDVRVDVWGLGAVLYELLCYQPPHRGRTLDEILAAARAGAVIPPSKVIAKRAAIPADLEAICVKALARVKEDRYASAREFQEDLQSYIEGTRDKDRRRGEAGALAAEGRKHLVAYRELEQKQAMLRVQAKQVAEKLEPHEATDRKGLLWSMEDEVDRLEQEAAGCFSRARAALDAAIQTDPTCQDARRALADLYWERFLEAEARRDTRDASFYRDLVEAHDDGRYVTRLKGDGSLSITSDPPGAEAILYRYVEERRVLVPGEPRPIGSTPTGEVALPMGSYVVVLQKPGYRDTRYPVFLGRSASHRGSVRLFREEEIGADFVHVPGGEFIRGGDPESYGGTELSTANVPDFFMARYPVTVGEYCEFLDALAARGEDVKDHVPQQADEVYIRCVDGRHQPLGTNVDPAVAARHPPGLETKLPVFAVSWHSASAFAKWRSERDGREYSLPPEDAWEKASRGVDGRYHPWGDRFDWTFTKGGLSRPERASPEPVGAFPADESPYGVRDMVGSIREWTSSHFKDEKDSRRVLRGGSWNLVAERHFRCATRFGYSPLARTTTFGFRLYAKPRR